MCGHPKFYTKCQRIWLTGVAMLAEWISQIDPFVVAWAAAVVCYAACTAANHRKWASFLAAFNQSKVFRFAGKAQIFANLMKWKQTKNQESTLVHQKLDNLVQFIHLFSSAIGQEIIKYTVVIRLEYNFVIVINW